MKILWVYNFLFTNFFQTLEEWTDKSRFLIRFEHLFEAQEDPQDFSKPVSVDLKSMFKVFNIEKVEEVILNFLWFGIIRKSGSFIKSTDKALVLE